MINHKNFQVGKKTISLMDDGFCCSEAIFLSVASYFEKEFDKKVIKIATPFRAGIGLSRQSICGAFTGGLLVIGYFFGRDNGSESDVHCQELASRFLEKFNSEFLNLHCSELIKMDACKQLTGRTAELLVEILRDEKKFQLS